LVSRKRKFGDEKCVLGRKKEVFHVRWWEYKHQSQNKRVPEVISSTLSISQSFALVKCYILLSDARSLMK
jgi:hypothetical protein